MNKRYALGIAGLVILGGGIVLSVINDRSALEVGIWSAVWVGLAAGNIYAWRRRNAR